MTPSVKKKKRSVPLSYLGIRISGLSVRMGCANQTSLSSICVTCRHKPTYLIQLPWHAAHATYVAQIHRFFRIMVGITTAKVQPS